jgi:hypothetical protein
MRGNKAADCEPRARSTPRRGAAKRGAMSFAMVVPTAATRQRLHLHVVPQHQLLGVGVEIHLLVHPLRHRMPVQMVLEPVRSYVSGTISGSKPWR